MFTSKVFRICLFLLGILLLFCVDNSLSIYASWITPLKKSSQQEKKIGDKEPGFDLTDEEMAKFKIWPMGIIPYYIDDLSYDKVLRDRIRGFLDNTNSLTNVHFLELPRPPEDVETRWIFFVNRRSLLDCQDHSPKDFTNQGVQKVVLGYDCMSVGGELAEAVLSIVGVPPQHNAPNRNQYISVVLENIIPEKRHLFEILKDSDWLFHDVEYDYSSAGHYPFHKYTINGSASIMPKREWSIDTPVGEGTGFSSKDIWKIKMLYSYITKKKNNNVQVPECVKLFEPGRNFSKYKPVSEEDIQPRNKPNKYLGLAEESRINYKDNAEEGVEKLDKSGSSNEDEDNKSPKEVPNEDVVALGLKFEKTIEIDDSSNENLSSIELLQQNKDDSDNNLEEVKKLKGKYNGNKRDPGKMKKLSFTKVGKK